MCNIKSFRDGKGEVVTANEKPKTAEELYLEVRLKQQLILNIVKNRKIVIVEEARRTQAELDNP